MLLTVLVLAVLGSLTYDLFFVVSFVGFLVIVELIAPANRIQQWRGRLRWIVVLGFLVFAYVAVRRILDILPPGVI